MKMKRKQIGMLVFIAIIVILMVSSSYFFCSGRFRNQWICGIYPDNSIQLICIADIGNVNWNYSFARGFRTDENP